METFKQRISMMTDRELYLAAKRMLTREVLGEGQVSRRCDLLFEECGKRNPSIFRSALDDAILTICSVENEMNGMRVIELKRIDFMSNYELRIFLQSIGAAKGRNPMLDDDEAVSATVEETLGVKFDSMMLCKVEGHSMIEANIREGDTLVVDSSAEPLDGDIIVVKFDGNLFVKRYRAFGKEVVLVSENPSYPNFRLRPGDDIHVFGIVKRVISDVSIR